MKAFLSNPLKKKQFLLLFVDSLIILWAFVSSYTLRVVFYEGGNASSIAGRLTWLVPAGVLMHIITLYVFELYNLETRRSNAKMLLLIIFSVILASGILVILSYLDSKHKLGRVVLATFLPLTICTVFLWRWVFFAFLQGSLYPNNLLFIGRSSLDEEILIVLENFPVKYYNPTGVIYEHRENSGVAYVNGETSQKSIFDLVEEREIRTIVVSEDLRETPILRRQLMTLRFKGVSIYDAPVFYMRLTAKVPVFHITEGWFLFHNQDEVFQPSYWQNLKRIMDIFFASVGLVLLAPLVSLSALAIKLTSKGPILFGQERIGLNKRPYTLLKLRTMIANAEARTGPIWAGKNDDRITRVGRILRKARIDEIPQLINVLRGDMSLVGPRPIRKCFEDENTRKIPFYDLRHMVRPGLTGWAQVKDFDPRAEDGPLERLQYDLFYIQNQSLFLDIFIILKTMQTVLFRHGQ